MKSKNRLDVWGIPLLHHDSGDRDPEPAWEGPKETAYLVNGPPRVAREAIASCRWLLFSGTEPEPGGGGRREWLSLLLSPRPQDMSAESTPTQKVLSNCTHLHVHPYSYYIQSSLWFIMLSWPHIRAASSDCLCCALHNCKGHQSHG